uniref:Small monomeric GTPase n=1 Tax=Syphacia muris TaxID=451379 RepID=A0A158R667_9BILA
MFASNRFKVLVVGSKDCGKTSFIKRLHKENFDNSPSSSNENLHNRALQLTASDGISIKIELSDIDIDEFNEIVKNVATLRQQQQCLASNAMSSSYAEFLDASGVFVLYDITNVISFNCLKTIIDDLAKLVAPDCDLILIGTKCDLKQLRQVSYQQAETFTYKLGLSLFETRTGLNCAAALREMVNKVFEKRAEADTYISHPVEENHAYRTSVLSQMFCRTWFCV